MLPEAYSGFRVEGFRAGVQGVELPRVGSRDHEGTFEGFWDSGQWVLGFRAVSTGILQDLPVLASLL